jgi:hypothetical protein
MNRVDHEMVDFPLVRFCSQTDADDITAGIGRVEGHFVQWKLAHDLAANSVFADHFNRQQRVAIELGEFFTKVAPVFAAYFFCFFHNFLKA